MHNNTVFTKRRESLYSWLDRENIDVAIIEDTEGRRSNNLRYLSGMVSDAVLFLFRSGRCVLVPWDYDLAQHYFVPDSNDDLVPYTDFNRSIIEAVKRLLSDHLSAKNRIELSSATPYPLYTEIGNAISSELVCRQKGIDQYLKETRAVKDQGELDIYKKAVAITNGILTRLDYRLADKELHSELDVSFFIEKEARKAGAEGTGFETLVAAPSRSFAIHPFPAYTSASIRKPGLSILDFGVKVDGYTTDVTTTILQDAPHKAQKKRIDCIHEAWELITDQLKPGASTVAIARAVDTFFEKHGFSMPHGLGHGIGLDTHEYPFFRNRADSDTELKPGMIVAIEPGLYDHDGGGVRLENDILITETGIEVLTNSRILYYPQHH